MTRFTELEQVIYGLAEKHLRPLHHADREMLIAEQAGDAFHRLQQAAGKAGFDLQPVSVFRGYTRQMRIVEAKAGGQRTLLDANGETLDFDRLSEGDLLHVIMRWSALPGLSRHHWGTDLDVYDASAMALADVELVPSEVNAGGPCAAMHDWLDLQIVQNASCGFFRPYAKDRGAIAPERWHLSYLPLSADYQRALQPQQVAALWHETEFSLAPMLIERLATLWPAYVDLPMDGQPGWVQERMQ